MPDMRGRGRESGHRTGEAPGVSDLRGGRLLAVRVAVRVAGAIDSHVLGGGFGSIGGISRVRGVLPRLDLTGGVAARSVGGQPAGTTGTATHLGTDLLQARRGGEVIAGRLDLGHPALHTAPRALA